MEKLLRSLARWVWEIQGEACSGRYKNTGLVIHEETITEMLLLRCVRVARGRQPGGGKRGRIPSFGVASFLSRRGRSSFTAFDVKMFSKAEEGGRKEKGGNGADWEWLFKVGDCEFGFRVQAKRLYKNSGYDGFGGNNKQNNDLIAQAQTSGLIPVYVFYNHGFGRDSHLFGGGSFIGGYSRRRSDWGCSVAHAECVRNVHTHNKANNKGRKGQVADIFPHMLPWNELFELALFLAGRKFISKRYNIRLNGSLRYDFISLGYLFNSKRYLFNLIECFGVPIRYFSDQCPLEWILKNYGPDGGNAYEKHAKFFKKYEKHIKYCFEKDPFFYESPESKLNIKAILEQIDDKEKMSAYVEERNLRGVAVFTLSESEGSRRDDPAERHSSKARR